MEEAQPIRDDKRVSTQAEFLVEKNLQTCRSCRPRKLS